METMEEKRKYQQEPYQLQHEVENEEEEIKKLFKRLRGQIRLEIDATTNAITPGELYHFCRNFTQGVTVGGLKIQQKWECMWEKEICSFQDEEFTIVNANGEVMGTFKMTEMGRFKESRGTGAVMENAMQLWKFVTGEVYKHPVRNNFTTQGYKAMYGDLNRDICMVMLTPPSKRVKLAEASVMRHEYFEMTGSDQQVKRVYSGEFEKRFAIFDRKCKGDICMFFCKISGFRISFSTHRTNSICKKNVFVECDTPGCCYKQVQTFTDRTSKQATELYDLFMEDRACKGPCTLDSTCTLLCDPMPVVEVVPDAE